MKYIYKRVLPDYECLDSWKRQEYIRLRVNRVQNDRVRRDGYRNGKKKRK